VNEERSECVDRKGEDNMNSGSECDHEYRCVHRMCVGDCRLRKDRDLLLEILLLSPTRIRTF